MNNVKKIRLASILGIVGNVFLFIIKIIVGILSKSQAMLADAFNSGGDIISSFMTFIGNKISSKPSDDSHNLGHGKAEYIYSLLISIFMILTSLMLLKSSLLVLINQEKFIFSKYLIIVCLITIIIKFSLFIYTSRLAKQSNNLLIKANSIDHRNDTFITLINLISICFALFNIYYLDGIAGIIISIWIIITASKLFKESYDILMDKSINETTKEEVYKIISNYKEIKKVQHFNSTPVGYQYQISFTIYVDGNMTTYESHEIANRLEKEIDSNIDSVYLTVIHVNPID